MATSRPIQRRFNTGDEPEFDLYNTEGKRALRVFMCGEYRKKRTGNGVFRPERHRCDKSECEICGRDRANKLKNRVLLAMKVSEIALSIIPKEELDLVFDEMSKISKREHILRLPLQDDSYAIFVSFNLPQLIAKLTDPQIVTHDSVEKIDWLKMQATPIGSRISGSLGIPPSTPSNKPNEKKFSIPTNSFVYPNNFKQRDEIETADLKSIADTIDLDPHTLEDIQNCLVKRDAVFMKYLNAYGVDYFVRRDYDNIYLSTIDWIASVQEYIPELIKRGYISQKRADDVLSKLPRDRQNYVAFMQSIAPEPIDYIECTTSPP